MQSAVEIKNDLELKINISIPADEYKTSFGKKVQDISKTAKVSGFRPGKVPLAYINKFYGPSIEAEVVDDMIKKYFDKVCKDHQIVVAGIEHVDVTQKKLGKDLEFNVDVEVFPSIKFADDNFTDITVDKFSVDVTAEDIKESVEKLRKSHATWNTAESSYKAKMDDKVVVDFNGVDAETNEEIANASSENFDLELGSNYLIKGFEEGVVGHKVGDKFDLNLEFPQDYHVSEHAGKKVLFKVELKEIKQAELPELNLDFCGKFGVKLDTPESENAENAEDVSPDTKISAEEASKVSNEKEKKELTKEELEQLRIKLEDRIKESLVQEAKGMCTNKYKDSIYKKLCKAKEINLPKVLVNEEINKLMAHRKELVKKYNEGQDVNLDLKREDFTDEAKTNVQLMLLLRSYVEQYEIKVDNERLKEKLGQQWGGKDAVTDDLLDWYLGDENRKRQLESQALEELAIESIEQKIKVNERKVSFKELVEENKQ